MKSTFSEQKASLLLRCKLYRRILAASLRSSDKLAVFKMAGVFVTTRMRALWPYKTGKNFPFIERKTFFCNEPWLGVFSITTSLDVNFCPCYLKLKIGNLKEAPLQEIWNAPQLVSIRSSFKKGKLPAACQSQLCPVALGDKN